ncbi:hypothetical protein KFK09_009555 [Dendrobium nobile]|uniref:Uncharacterized protein n=1 Tax=Dendrobium nobile TaxID=94219 RepID=A0A8T3BHS0_DENNO|nr:hypothetical protein KFK09_009555 [Dendrobium nobile]
MLSLKKCLIFAFIVRLMGILLLNVSNCIQNLKTSYPLAGKVVSNATYTSIETINDQILLSQVETPSPTEKVGKDTLNISDNTDVPKDRNGFSPEKVSRSDKALEEGVKVPKVFVSIDSMLQNNEKPSLSLNVDTNEGEYYGRK